MKTHRNTFKLVVSVAAIGASALAMAGHGRPTAGPVAFISPLAPASAPARDIPVVRSDRTPVIALSSTIGDVGFEIFDGKTQRYSLATLPEDATDAIVYINVDSIDPANKKNMRGILKLATDLNWTVIAESGSWNVPRLHAFLKAYYPRMNTKGLQNVSVRITSDRKRSSVSDVTPSKAAVEVGIDYLKTTEGQALLGNTFTTKTLAPGSDYVWFANNAYSDTASNRQVGDRYYTVALNRDVVKVWKSTSNGTTDCIVSWRGSHTASDWLITNLQSQFGTPAPVPGESSGNNARIGYGYAERLKNYRSSVNSVACNNNYKLTGHSLGGAMAEAYAFTIRYTRPRIEVYNPSRIGNASFRDQILPIIGPSRIEVFCRTLDPVWPVPLGLQHIAMNNGCTYWAGPVSWFNPFANHALSLWM